MKNSSTHFQEQQCKDKTLDITSQWPCTTSFSFFGHLISEEEEQQSVGQFRGRHPKAAEGHQEAALEQASKR